MAVPDVDELLAADREHVWHPYGPMPATQVPLPVVSASGVRLRLADGRELVDGMASWWCAVHGHRHPALDAAMRAQLDRMPHVMFGGLTHEPAVALATRLVAITPAPLQHVFFADSGSVAVEVALKMVLQHWRGAGRPEKRACSRSAARTTATPSARWRSATRWAGCTTSSPTSCPATSSPTARRAGSTRP